MKAQGAALATVVSQALSMILCIIYLKRNRFIFDFSLRSFGFDRHKLSLLFKIGLPTMINSISVSVSFLFILALVNTISDIAGSAVGAVGRINAFAILPAIAISSAVSAMVAQNIGANKLDRAVKTMRVGMLLTLAVSSLIFALTQIFPELILGLFLAGSDPNYAQYISDGKAYMRTFSLDYLIVPFQFCFNSLFIGAGHTNFALVNGLLASLLIRIPFCYLFGIVLDLGLTGVGIGAPAASIIASLTALIFFLTGKWKKQRIIMDAELT